LAVGREDTTGRPFACQMIQTAPLTKISRTMADVQIAKNMSALLCH
jgi:hypothetical protein